MFRWEDCLEGHVLIGIILSLATFILCLVTTFASPFIKGVTFLDVQTPSNGTVRFGGFGYCIDGQPCVQTLGYGWTGGEVQPWATRSHFLFALALASMFFALIALVLSLLRVGKFVWNPKYFRTAGVIAFLFGLLAGIFALINWVGARLSFNSQDIEADYGAALWLGLVGVIINFAAIALGGPAFAGRFLYRAQNNVAYNV